LSQINGQILSGVAHADGGHHGRDTFIQMRRLNIGERERKSERMRLGDGQDTVSLFAPEISMVIAN
jgi:hypothetical protein